MILIISDSAADGHVAPVVAELARRGADVQVFDPATYPDNAVVTMDGTPHGVRSALSWRGGEVDLSSVQSVWYRRPGELVLSDKLDAAEDKWLHLECQHLFRGMWANLRTRWVSNPAAIRQASLKPLQLQLATELGFDVPPFTITNDVDHAAGFIKACSSGAVVKVLVNPSIMYDDHVQLLYTHLITDDDQRLLAAVRYGPTFLQAYVNKELDVRVTVIGNKVFAVGIRANASDGSRVDFRRAPLYDLPHAPLVLPERLSSRCVTLVEQLGLRFGAIDLVKTPDDRYFFLEINPNGQWYWLEEMTDIPLTRAMGDLLTGN